MKNRESLNWDLLVKYLNKETNSKENSEVETWLSLSKENQEELEECRKTLQNVDAYYKVKSFDSASAWNNVQSQINPGQQKVVQLKKVRKEKIAQFYKYAAIIVVAILLGSVAYYIGFNNQMPDTYSEIVSAEKQVVNEYVLPDGSVVTLNSNSKLEFPKQFASDVREVSISGEAFFDVKPNPDKPFIINAGNTQVKVLGTSFNVCAYPSSETVEVVVATGKVQVTRKGEDLVTENQQIFLNPGEKGTLYTEKNFLEKTVNIDPNFLSWKTQDLIFNKTPLVEVVRCLEKTYHIDIELAEPSLNNLLYEGHFDQKPISFVLDVIRLTFNLELTEENEQFTLSSRTNE